MNGRPLLRAPSPERPGPGPLPAAALRALQIEVGRRLQGMLAGDYRSSHYGDGVELAQVRPYVPGDDVRRIEWNVTARTGEPHVRVNMAERVLVTWLLLDTSPSMHFGTADRRKADVADGVAIALGHVATRRGNRLGVMTFGDRNPTTLPPTQGRHGLLGLLGALQREPEAGQVGATSLGDALRRTGAIARQRGVVAVVSDFRGPLDWRKPLLELMSRHEVLAVEIRDPREQELPDVGELWLVDPETGPAGARRHAQPRAARALRAGRRGGAQRAWRAILSALGVPHVVLSTSGDWLRPLAALPRSAAGELRRSRSRCSRSSSCRCSSRCGSPQERAAHAAGGPLLDARADPEPRREPPGYAGATCRSALLLLGARRADRRRRAAARATCSVPRKEATVVLAIDVSRSMTAQDVQPTRLAAARLDGRRRSSTKVPKEYSVAVVGIRHARVRRDAADHRPRARTRRARLARAERGHRARRRGLALRASSAQRQRTSDGTVPPTSVLLISDGARDGGQTAPLAARAAKRAPRTSPSRPCSSGRRTASSRRSSSAASRSRSACRRAPGRCSRSRS